MFPWHLNLYINLAGKKRYKYSRGIWFIRISVLVFHITYRCERLGWCTFSSVLPNEISKWLKKEKKKEKKWLWIWEERIMPISPLLTLAALHMNGRVNEIIKERCLLLSVLLYRLFMLTCIIYIHRHFSVFFQREYHSHLGLLMSVKEI